MTDTELKEWEEMKVEQEKFKEKLKSSPLLECAKQYLSNMEKYTTSELADVLNLFIKTRADSEELTADKIYREFELIFINEFNFKVFNTFLIQGSLSDTYSPRIAFCGQDKNGDVLILQTMHLCGEDELSFRTLSHKLMRSALKTLTFKKTEED